MLRSLPHYFRRARELGPVSTARRVQQRGMQACSTWGQTLWWGWQAGREMSDAALLAQMGGRWPTVAALAEHLAARPDSSYLLPHDREADVADFMAGSGAGATASVVAAADAACRGEFDLLGRKTVPSADIDWHADPGGGWRWPVIYITRLEALIWSPHCPADLKPTWELNRHQHFAVLGMAWWLTQDSRYVHAFGHQLASWIRANPHQHGINWFSNLEVAIRLIAWVMAFQCFRRSGYFQEQIAGVFLKSLSQQAQFLRHHLTTGEPVPNNHLIGEAAALAILGAVFPEFSAAAEWRADGLRILCEQVAAQTHPDGVNKEQATGYQRFVTEFLCLVVILGRRNLLPRSQIVEDALNRMMDYLAAMLPLTGHTPLWGDADDSHAFDLVPGSDFWDFRPLLAIGAVLFERTTWKPAGRPLDAQAYMLLGAEGLKVWEKLNPRPPELNSRGFEHAGIYLIHDAWNSDPDFASFRCGSFGLGGEGFCAHSHCDLLSVLLWIGERPLLVDSGTYSYHGPWRDVFRLTAAHNTLMVDGEEQALPRNTFAWQQVPQAACLEWTENSVVGGMILDGGLWHRRRISNPRPGQWGISDRLTGSGSHSLAWFFHFAPDLSLSRGAGNGRIGVQEQGQSYVNLVPPSNVELSIQTGWHSVSYGQREPNPLLTGTWSGEIPASGLTFTWRFERVKEGE